MTIENKSGGSVTYDPSIAGSPLADQSRQTVRLHRAEKTAVGKGKVHYDPLVHNARITTDSGMIPLIMLDVGSTHGMYLGYEWELGGFQVASGFRSSRHHCLGTPHNRGCYPRPTNEIFTIPSVYYGTYQGDIDDGSNRFKKWFWNHKITRSLHDHADEPWTEVCMQDIGGKGNASMTGSTPQSAYDRSGRHRRGSWSRWISGTAPASAGIPIGTGSFTPRCGPTASILPPRPIRPG